MDHQVILHKKMCKGQMKSKGKTAILIADLSSIKETLAFT